MTEQSLFIQAAEIADPADRAALVDRACAGDERLRRRVLNLLERHADAGGFLTSPAAGPGSATTLRGPGGTGDPAAPPGDTTTFRPRVPPPDTTGFWPQDPPPDRPGGSDDTPAGVQLGPYRLVKTLGEGGMGTVWLAEQDKPVRRRVAVKVIKAGLDSRQVLARFEAERQALALMDHPNIARVLDAGTAPDGRPYFVMELVEGPPVTAYCDDRRMPPRDRLRLFVEVCRAVQHAHQKGVIHRDLKPSNILVAEYDGTPVPKVIDFGIAKALRDRLTDHTLATGLGAVVGTPEYMSPEQADLDNPDVDTRSDVYSLGVLLYELLTGGTPVDRRRQKRAALLDVLRAVREEEPARPSARLAAAADLPALAAARGLDPRRLTGLVRGDLDWVAMKCLEKDRAGRYETANGLARDVERYLSDEPVDASPPSRWDRLRKFTRRNRRALAAAAVAAAGLVVGVAGLAAYGAQQGRLAREQTALAADRTRFGDDQAAAVTQLEGIQQRTQAELYRALMSRAAALRAAREPGYRVQVWESLRAAAVLDVPERDPAAIRAELLACLGDPIGLDPVFDPPVTPVATPAIPAAFRAVVDGWQASGPKTAPQTAVSPDGTRLAVAGGPGLPPVAVLGPDGRPVATLAATPLGHISRLAFTPDGEAVVAGCDQGFVVWSAKDLSSVWFCRGDSAHGVAVHPTGHLLAVGTYNRRVELWSLPSRRLVATLAAPRSGAEQAAMIVSGLRFSADGGYLLAPAGPRVIGWAVTRTPEKVYLYGHTGGVMRVAFSPAGNLLATTGKDRMVRLWDPSTGELRGTLAGHAQDVQDAAFTPDGRYLATGDWDGTVILWDPATGREVARVRAATTTPIQIWRVRFDRSGRVLAAGGSGGLVAWDVRVPPGRPPTLTPLGVVSRSSEDRLPYYDFVLGPDGLEAAFGTPRPGHTRVRRFDGAGSREVEWAWMGHVLSVHPDATGDRFAYLTPDLRVGVFDWALGRTVRMSSYRAAAAIFAASPDLRWAATKHAGDRVDIVDLEADRVALTLPRETTDIWSFDWSQDQQRVALGLPDGTAVVWNLGEVRARLAEFGTDVPGAQTPPGPASPRPAPTPPAEKMTSPVATHPQPFAAAAAKLYEADGLTRERKYAEAAAAAREAVRLAPDWAEAHSKLGGVLRDQGKTADAIAEYREAVRLRPDWAEVQFQLGTTLMSLGRMADAEGPLRKAAAGGFPPARVAIPECLLFQEKWAEAADAYRAMIKADPESEALATNWCWFLATCPDPAFRDPSAAAALARKLTDRFPTIGYNWQLLGIAHYRAGKWAEALAAFDTVPVPISGRRDNGFFRAMTLWHVGDRDRARESYRESMTAFKRFPRPRPELVRIQAEAQTLISALEPAPPPKPVPTPRP